MSDTPRTDVAEHNMGSVVEPHYVVDADFSRYLERELVAARAELAEAKAQLPAEMQECNIVFKQCKLGHGWLTATNWVQHECQICELAEAQAEIVRLTKRKDECSNGWDAALAQCDKAIAFLHVYRNDTPLGNQPHMLAHEVDQFLKECGK